MPHAAPSRAVRRIVIGTDFSPPAAAALATGVAIARRCGAHVTAAHAALVTSAPPPMIAGSPELSERWHSAVGRRATDVRRRLQQIVDAARRQDAHIAPLVIHDHADAGLVGAADDLDADLLVVGAHGAGADQPDQGVGTTALRVLRGTRRPVLLVRAGGAQGAFRRVLVGTDGSATAEAALATAVAVAGPDAAIDLAHVINPTTLALDHWADHGDMVRSGRSPTRAVSEWAEAQGTELARRCGAARVEFKLFEGNPARVLRRQLGRERYDLAVVGSHGYRPWRTFLLGSVAESVAHQASCSVLVVPPRPGEGY